MGYGDCSDMLENFGGRDTSESKDASAVIVPHAGWSFSGKLAFSAVKSLRESDVIVLAGGHLRESDPVILSFFEKFETPLGNIPCCLGLSDEIASKIRYAADRYADNTTEIQLPFIKYLFPGSEICVMRIPPDPETAYEAAGIVKEYAERRDLTISFIGSTDLTHYGPNYGFAPKGSGASALQWVKEVNDREFIDLISSDKIKEAVRHSIDNQSACSAGGAAAAAFYGGLSKKEKGTLIDHFTSFDIMPSSSFVGYCGIKY